MAKRDFIQRYILIINRLKTRAATFAELQEYLIRQAQLTGDHLDVSQRTLQRDLNEIRSLFEIDIQFNRKEGVYEIVEAITEKPIERIIESYEIISALNYSQSVVSKLYLEQRKNQGTEYLHGLLYAIENGLQVSFVHQSFWKDHPEERKVQPIAIKESQNRWYLICFDLDKKEIRNFGLDRLQTLKITDTKLKPIAFDVKEYYQHAFGVETYKPAEKIVLRFTIFQAQYIRSLPLHPSQQLIQTDDTYCWFSYQMHPTHDFKMEILKYGDEVTVVEPESLKQSIKQQIMNMAALYQ